MIGDFFTGSTMIAGDADSDVDPFRRTIIGKTRFSGALLYLSPRYAAMINGKTVLNGSLTFPAHQHLGALVVGQTDLSDSVLTGGHPPLTAEVDGGTTITATFAVRTAVQLGASIIGMTRFLSPDFTKSRALDFQGDVGAQAERTLVMHGEVLSGTGAVFPTPYVDERQPVPHFV